jgi:phage/plasmid-associated DNA primase
VASQSNSTESAEASQSRKDKSSFIVNDLLELLGADAVLLPIPCGEKGPRIKGWQSFTPDRMQDPKYLAKLNGQCNIGVLLGNGRVTIDLDRDEDVEPFLALNPKLRDTLRTKRVRGCNLWARIKGKYPPACKLTTKTGQSWGEWRADRTQTVIHGEAIDRKKGETEPTAYKIENRASPVEIAFDEINWPNELILPWKSQPLSINLEELIRCYGEPFYRDEEGIPSAINEVFWAGLHAMEHTLLWEPEERDFYTYNPQTGIYQEESSDAIKRQISERLLEASRQTKNLWLEKQRTDYRLNAITAHLRGLVEKRGAFSQPERRIHLANGVFRFENGGQLLSFSPSFISRNASPIVFDENARCDRFLNELIYPAVREDDVIVIQKYFGLCLLGRNLIQRILILDGKSARGKTQLANVIQGVVGRVNCTQLRTELLGERFETYRFTKKTLLVGVDVMPDFLSTPGASVLKGLVGGDWFDGEKKGSNDSFQFQGDFGVVITSNTRLRVRLSGDVGAWRRRLLIVRYEGPPPQVKIPEFGEKLVREEGSGILNFAIDGLAMLLDDIDEAGDIVLTERQRTVVDSLLAESDSLRLFLLEKVEKVENADYDLAVSEIVEEYAAFCPEKGWNPLPITEVQRSLEGLMLQLFHVSKSHSIKRDGRSVRGFYKIRFKS